MTRIVVFGNSGSGKSTYARGVAQKSACAYLDLDTVAWDPEQASPTRLPLAESARMIERFLAENPEWVIEGCYADLLERAIPQATELVFLDPGAATCRENARRRPWEPHKYASKAAQDANLPMLLGWIDQYYDRDDEFSYRAHRALFDRFAGRKRRFSSNHRLDRE